MFHQTSGDGEPPLRSKATRGAPEQRSRDVIDGAERGTDEDSFEMTKRLVREEGLCRYERRRGAVGRGAG